MVTLSIPARINIAFLIKLKLDQLVDKLAYLNFIIMAVFNASKQLAKKKKVMVDRYNLLFNNGMNPAVLCPKDPKYGHFPVLSKMIKYFHDHPTPDVSMRKLKLASLIHSDY